MDSANKQVFNEMISEFNTLIRILEEGNWGIEGKIEALVNQTLREYFDLKSLINNLIKNKNLKADYEKALEPLSHKPGDLVNLKSLYACLPREDRSSIGEIINRIQQDLQPGIQYFVEQLKLCREKNKRSCLSNFMAFFKTVKNSHDYIALNQSEEEIKKI